MNRVRITFAFCAWPFAYCLFPARAERVVIYPQEIHDVLPNPGMGIVTFQRFNGDPLNPGLKWSEAGPTSAEPLSGENSDFPLASIAYCRWFWSAFETEKGKVRWEILDTALDQARRHGQTLAIRLMPYDKMHPLPEWYRRSGARRANQPAAKDGEIWEPDFSDPLYLQHWGEFVRAVGARYDGHPYLESVDISSIGYWGEGWSPYMPSFPHQKALIDIYFDAFPHTPLLMNFDEQEALTYGTSRGAGWRFDCLGDLRKPWSHMLDFYPLQIVRARIQDVWHRAHVSMETCGVPAGWLKNGWDVHYILSEALRWHVSSLNVKSTAIPSQWRSEFEEFQKRMGYRFVLRRAEFEGRVRAGARMSLKTWWVNVGVAPVYREYRLAFALSRAVIPTAADARKWLPGDALYEDSLPLPEDLEPGEHEFRVALLDPRTGQPAIRLAIAGRRPDGWYPLGRVRVTQ